MENKTFKLNVVGTFDTGVTEGEVKTFPKAYWPDICRILASLGVKNITSANLDAAGTNIALPADALHAGAGVK
jgi:hypothetical protein